MNESWCDRYLAERSDKYIILIAYIGFFMFCYGVFNLILHFNELVNIIINVVISFIGFSLIFLMYMLYFRTRGL